VTGYLSKGLNARGAGTIIIGGNAEILLTSMSPYSTVGGAVTSGMSGVGDAIQDYSLVHIKGDLKVEAARGAGLYAQGNLNNSIIVNGKLNVKSPGNGIQALNGGKIFIDPSADATSGSADNDTKIVMRHGAVNVSGSGSAGLRAEITNTASAGNVDVEMTGGTINASGYGIYAENRGAGSTTVSASGDIASDGYGVLAANGPVTTDASGNLVSVQYGGGLSVGNGADLTVETSGAIRSVKTGVVAVNSGVGATLVTTNGPVTSTAGNGILAHNGGVSVDGNDRPGGGSIAYTTGLTVNAIGDVSGANSGITAINYGFGPLSVTASGTVTGTDREGIFVRNVNGNDMTVETAQTVTGNTLGMYINNRGVDGGIADGDLVTSGMGSTRVTAQGDVIATGDNGAGMLVLHGEAGLGTDLTVEVVNVTGGSISGTGIAASNNGSGSTSLISTGTVTGGFLGIQVENGAAATDLAVDVNNVFGGNFGLFAASQGTGTISAIARGAVTATGDSNLFVTSGIVVAMSGEVSSAKVTTLGMVSGTDAGILIQNRENRAAGETNVNIMSDSVVQGGQAGVLSYSDVAQDVTINNAGRIQNQSGSSSSVAIGSFDLPAVLPDAPASQASTTVNNTGLVLGTMVVSGKANVFNNEAGGVWNTAGGTNDFGADVANNRIVNESGATILAALDGAASTTTFNNIASLSNAGTLMMGNGLAGDRTIVNGDYIGAGGTVVLNTVLGNDSSATDQLVINGDTSGSSLVRVLNAGGLGAQTVEGIKIIDVAGASNGTFALDGDFEFLGEQAVVAGAYAYRLQQGGTSTPNDGDWYLRSKLKNSDPQYNPGAPIYETYPQHLLGLNGLPTLQQRVGNRYWSGEGAKVVAEGADAIVAENPATDGVRPTYTESNAFWARLEGTYASVDPAVSTSNASYDQNVFRLQSGLDFQLMENEAGKLIGGITLHYVHGKSDIASPSGNGDISTDGYGVGGTLTWYGNNGFYVDGQGQATWYGSNLSSATAGRSLVDGNDAFGYALSLETGKRIDLNNGLTLTPQAQLVYSNVDFDSFVDPWGVGVSLGNGDSLRGRLGVSLDKETSWTAANGTLSRNHLYGVANLHYEFLQGTEVDVAGVSFENRPERLWGEIGAGVSYNWNDDKFSLYGEGSVSTSLSSFGDSYALKGTAGFRVKW